MSGLRDRPPVAILCGGRGTRLQEHARELPKSLVEIGGEPILGHVIGLYAAQGFTRFVLATGYRGELIDTYTHARAWPEGVSVECVDTGIDTATGGRIKLLEKHLTGSARAASAGGANAGDAGPGEGSGEGSGAGTFCATYADGLADIDLGELLAFHVAHGAAASMTVVRPELQFGVAELDGDACVTGFREKPRSEHWINGGFFCFEPALFRYLREDSILEREPLRALAAAGHLRAYRHEGFWECMDTYKDAIALNDLWASGRAPWREPARAGGRAGTQNQ